MANQQPNAPLEDDMYLTDGEWYDQPAERAREIDTERRNLQKAKPLVKDLIARLDIQIEYYGTVDAIPGDITTDPVVYHQMIEANKRVRDILRAEREYISSLLSKHS
jgi:alpha-D-ribose 1-methylphosphonate 5-triphosphate synthase subunit PhnI